MTRIISYVMIAFGVSLIFSGLFFTDAISSTLPFLLAGLLADEMDWFFLCGVISIVCGGLGMRWGDTRIF